MTSTKRTHEPSLFEWPDTLTEKRNQLFALAHRVGETDKIADDFCKQNGWNTLSFIQKGIANPSSIKGYPEIEKASAAQRDMKDLIHELVHDHNLDYYLVRKDVAMILNPTESERKICDDVLEERKRQSK